MTEIQEFNFEFRSPAEVNIEESASGSAIIEGTLLAEGVSRNNNLYELPEMENIAKQAEGIPLYYGTKVGFNPKTGTICNSLHDNSDEQRIGKVIQTTLDRVSKKIHFIAEVFNTEAHPDIIQQIKSGWGVSIGGKCRNVEWVKDALGKKLLRVRNMIVNHLQVIPPQTIRGMDAAKIENVNIQETYEAEDGCMMLFDIPIQETLEADIPTNININIEWI